MNLTNSSRLTSSEALFTQTARQSSSSEEKNEKLRFCIDFTNLNKINAKDSFLVASIDEMVDAIAGHELLSFMDAYLGYNQIKMHSPDEDMTAFTTGRAIYCYKVMPFDLKNAGATFQRMVNQVFKELIRNTIEVYVDDMLIKSLDRSDHVKNLGEAFALLRKI